MPLHCTDCFLCILLNKYFCLLLKTYLEKSILIKKITFGLQKAKFKIPFAGIRLETET